MVITVTVILLLFFRIINKISAVQVAFFIMTLLLLSNKTATFFRKDTKIGAGQEYGAGTFSPADYFITVFPRRSGPVLNQRLPIFPDKGNFPAVTENMRFFWGKRFRLLRFAGGVEEVVEERYCSIIRSNSAGE